MGWPEALVAVAFFATVGWIITSGMKAISQ